MSDVDKSIWIAATPEVVFAHLTEAERMVRWCGLDGALEATPGGTYRLDMGAAGMVEGRFLRVEPPRFVSWEVLSASGADVPRHVIEISVTPEAGGCRVEVRHTGLEAPFDGIAGCGWDHHLARLSVAATGGAPGADPLCQRSFEDWM